MESALKIRLNVCKSWSCPNLGIADAADYVSPVYRLGYRAMECLKCGGLPPLFDEHAWNSWFAQMMKQKQGDTGIGCPHCYHTTLIRYGRTQSGSARVQCQACKRVFTPKRVTPSQQLKMTPLLRRLNLGQHTGETTQYRTLIQAVNACEQQLHFSSPVVSRMATQVFTHRFQGKTGEESLYIIVSTDADSGRVLQLTTNYCQWQVSDSLRYRGSSCPVIEKQDIDPVEQIQRQEAQFMARSQFDEIRYGHADMKRNEQGSIIRPAIALHGHFQRLKCRYPQIAHHYLAHECVLRGAAITAWSAQVRTGKTHLWFVVENAAQPVCAEPSFCHTGTWRMGWWENIWQRWSADEMHKMVGLLTGQKRIKNPSEITLASAKAFIDWLKAHPWESKSSALSAKVMSLHLVCLAQLYNQSLLSGQGDDLNPQT